MNANDFAPLVLIPANLDLHSMFPDWVKQRKIRKDWAAILLDLILQFQLNPNRNQKKKQKRNKSKKGFVEIHSHVIGRFVSPDFKKQLCDELIQKKIIEMIETSCPKEFSSDGKGKCQEYRVHKQYVTSLKLWEITCRPSSKRFLEGLKRHRDETEVSLNKPDMPIAKMLYDDLFRLSFNETRAHDVIESIGSESASKQLTARFRYEAFRMGRIWAKIGKHGGRFYSNLTTLKKELRRTLQADGQSLIELDISCCQPLILSMELDTGTNDLRKFRELTQSGTFYDQIIEDLDWPYDRKPFVKTSVCKVFQGKDSEKFRKGISHYLREQFPSVMSWLDGAKKASYLEASHKLQRMESDLMIHGVANRFKTLFPEAFIGTVHDSFLIHPEFEDELRGIIFDVFKPRNVKPKITKKE